MHRQRTLPSCNVLACAALQPCSANHHQMISQDGERWRRAASVRTAIVALAVVLALMLLQLTPLGAQTMVDHSLRAAVACRSLSPTPGCARACQPLCDASN